MVSLYTFYLFYIHILHMYIYIYIYIENTYTFFFRRVIKLSPTKSLDIIGQTMPKGVGAWAKGRLVDQRGVDLPAHGLRCAQRLP